ncbi:MAG: hypothetical protein COB17_00775 [Sulfurimonas sp.]|nr:MAG: hypothetical protein COB17_00775 [Sulfurimonas sp.]
MENNQDELLIEICDMLRNPNDYKSLSIEAICSSLEILHNRIMKTDSSILNNHITQAEYEEYFEELFSSLNLVGLDELIAEIKQDIKNIGDTNDND